MICVSIYPLIEAQKTDPNIERWSQYSKMGNSTCKPALCITTSLFTPVVIAVQALLYIAVPGALKSHSEECCPLNLSPSNGKGDLFSYFAFMSYISASFGRAIINYEVLYTPLFAFPCAVLISSFIIIFCQSSCSPLTSFFLPANLFPSGSGPHCSFCSDTVFNYFLFEKR